MGAYCEQLQERTQAMQAELRSLCATQDSFCLKPSLLIALKKLSVFFVDDRKSHGYDAHHLKRSGILLSFIRSVAQPGSASVLGAECRGFESLHSDHFF